MNTRLIGSKGELLAAKYLEKKGYDVLSTNWTCRWGELDIICKENYVLVFVEVKYVSSNYFSDPSFKINPKKLFSLERSIQIYLSNFRDYYEEFRLDAVCIYINPQSSGLNIKHYENITLFG